MEEKFVEPEKVEHVRAKIETVIKIEYTIGDGTHENPYRAATEYRTLYGELIARVEKKVRNDYNLRINCGYLG